VGNPFDHSCGFSYYLFCLNLLDAEILLVAYFIDTDMEWPQEVATASSFIPRNQPAYLFCKPPGNSCPFLEPRYILCKDFPIPGTPISSLPYVKIDPFPTDREVFEQRGFFFLYGSKYRCIAVSKREASVSLYPGIFDTSQLAAG
jgi:hypothetical protein